MTKGIPSYEELQARLEQAEAALAALRRGEVDLVLGETGPLVVRVKSLVEENERLAREWQITFDAVQSAVFLTDETYTIVRCNQAAAELFGRPIEQMIGAKCYRIVHGQHSRYEACPYQSVCREKERRTMVFEQDGRWLEMSVDPVLDAAGNFTGTVHVVNDITERKWIEEQLFQSEQRYRLLAETTPDVIILHDMQGRIQYVNRAGLELSGLTEEQVIGRSITAFVASEFQNGIRQRQAQRAAGNGSLYTYEAAFLDKGGQRHTMEVCSSPVMSEGKVEQILLVARDITERKRAEEELRESESRFSTIFFTNPVSQSILSQVTGQVIEVNDACCDLYGYRRAELIGADPGQLNLWADPAKEPRILNELQQTGRVLPTEVKLRRKSGEIRTVLFSVEPISWKGTPSLLTTSIDITERKQAEQALRASERRYASLVEALPAGVFRTDARGQTTYVSRRWCEISGLEAEKALGDGWLEAVHPEDRSNLAASWQQAAADGRVSVAQYRFLRPDGSTCWVIGQAIPEKDERGQVTGYVGAIVDITAQEQAEEALRAEHDKMLALFDSLEDIIYVADMDTHEILFANRRTKEMFGKELVSKICYQEFQHRDQPCPFCTNDKIRALRHEPYRWEYYNPVLRKYYEITDQMIQWPDGREVRFELARNITERKRAEEQLREEHLLLRTLVDHLPLAIYVKDKAGRKTLSNPVDQRNLGVGSEAEALGRTDFDFFPREQAERFTADDRRVLEEGLPVLGREEQLTRPDGSQIWQLTYKVPLRNPAGEIVGLIGFGLDITERRRAEEERSQLQQQLLQSQKLESIGRLAGGVAHDFNNMLNIVIGYGEMIMQKLHPSDPLRDDVREIIEAGHRSAALTRQLLAFSRKQTLQPEVLDLNCHLRSIERMLRRLIGEDIELQMVLAEDLGRVWQDPGQFDQIIMNLAVNARDAMPTGGTLTIKTENVEVAEPCEGSLPGVLPGKYVMVSLSDSGCGMDETVRAHLFEPFFTTKEMGKGTGLGLATVYGIVKQSEGHIFVDSDVGKGTTFRIYLPQTREAPQMREGRAREETEIGSRKRVLVVEDEEALRGLFRALLSTLGFEVVVAANGGEALLLVEEQGLRPDLLITDVVMPAMSGAVLAERLRRTSPSLKVLFMSGYTDDAISRHGVSDPGTRFVQKPFTLEELASKIRQVMAGE